MATKISDLRAEIARLNEQITMLSTALSHYVTLDKADATEHVLREDHSWSFNLFGSTRADGGYVVESFSADGQRPWRTVHRLDDLYRREHEALRYGGQDAHDRCCALERLTVKRNAVLFNRAA